MRLSSTPSALLYAITLLLSQSAQPTHATPYPRELDPDIEARELHDSILIERNTCANPCGWAQQLCCKAGETCYTDANNQAQCGAGTAAALTAAAAASNGGYWQYYTTTYVETDLVTRTQVMSSYIAATTTYVQATTTYVPVVATTVLTCANANQICGNICCSSDQYCYAAGQCVAAAGGSSSFGVGTIYIAGSYTAPLRPTSSTLVVVTATVPFQTPVATGANITLTTSQASTAGGGLSPGAIAGIVIGVLVGLALLALICFCCIVRGIWRTLFGGGKRRERVDVYEERHHHSSGGGGGGGRTWYGGNDRPSRPPKKQSSGVGGLGAAGLGLGALAVFLGLKRRRDRRDEKSEYSASSGYYSSDYTSASE
ncbi:hypothetical protein B0A49_01195 [Cryomyces minteri]|uniref:Mid2 domain-containing protein n=1 Tax=Cryomyces minteri TaxID=331657 RepID=A0A4U0XWY5_9PEZI|nr:hypothetical protein B0A49_11953 [Cryomyces minteri]TKA80418.1 hypothetical protein B0A49_01195 [Cryomyces minteri]